MPSYSSGKNRQSHDHLPVKLLMSLNEKYELAGSGFPSSCKATCPHPRQSRPCLRGRNHGSHGSRERTIAVSCTRLSLLRSLRLESADLIKVDAEGTEDLILRDSYSIMPYIRAWKVGAVFISMPSHVRKGQHKLTSMVGKLMSTQDLMSAAYWYVRTQRRGVSARSIRLSISTELAEFELIMCPDTFQHATYMTSRSTG
jgi:hypothetical protein